MSAYATNIQQETLENTFYRVVLVTTDDMQLVLMSLEPGEYIPKEIHEGSQFIRVESGEAYVNVNGEVYNLGDDEVIVIPGNTEHYVENVGDGPLKLYSIYTPPEHSIDEVDVNQPLS